jgi:hypothetical protein
MAQCPSSALNSYWRTRILHQWKYFAIASMLPPIAKNRYWLALIHIASMEVHMYVIYRGNEQSHLFESKKHPSIAPVQMHPS